MGEYIDRTFAVNLAENATVTSDKDDGYHTADALKTDSYDEYFKTFDGENTAEILIELAKKSDVTHIVMKEHIPMGQRIEKYTVYAELENGVWKTVESGTTVGYKRIMKFDSVHTDKIRISITDSRICPILSFVGVY